MRSGVRGVGHEGSQHASIGHQFRIAWQSGCSEWRLERFDQRPVRNRNGARRGPATQNAHRGRPRQPLSLERQAALADAGLAEQDDDAAVAGSGRSERVVDLGEFGVAPDDDWAQDLVHLRAAGPIVRNTRAPGWLA
jgi:hypothetical protein